jgi:hypothetical protein
LNYDLHFQTIFRAHLSATTVAPIMLHATRLKAWAERTQEPLVAAHAMGNTHVPGFMLTVIRATTRAMATMRVLTLPVSAI